MKQVVDALTVAWAKWAPRAVMVLAAVVGCVHPDRHGSGPGGAPLPNERRAHEAQGHVDFQKMSDEDIVGFCVARLGRHVQPDGPVGLVREAPEVMAAVAGPVYGYTQRLGPGYLIHVSTEIHGAWLAEVICHEWAHALVFPDSAEYVTDIGDCGGHGPQWGVENSRSFRAVWYDVDSPDYRVIKKDGCAGVGPVQPIEHDADDE